MEPTAPTQLQALLQQGLAHHRAGRLAEAEALYREVLASAPQTFEALYLAGVAATQRTDYAPALALLTQALEVNTASAEAAYSRGLVFKALHRMDDALKDLDRAIALKPAFAPAHNDRGIVLRALKRDPAALASYDQALALKPDFASAWNNRALVLAALGQTPAALKAHDKAISLEPDNAGLHANHGNTLNDAQHFEEAVAAYQNALRLDADYPFVRGMHLFAKMMLCDWHELEKHSAQLAQTVEAGRPASPPFPIVILTDSAPLQRKAAEVWTREMHPVNTELGPAVKRPRAEKIRLGYFSGDFHNHATMALMAELFERHEKTKFALTAFSFGPQVHDDMRVRALAAFDKFIDVRERPDLEIAALARKLEIDIAVDLKGFTQDSRPGIFAARAAPIQAQFIGYPGTMGAEYIDYLIADPTVIPAHARMQYSEKVVTLPHSYQVNDRQRPASGRCFTRADLGLPPSGFVFCSFNNTYKFTPPVFGAWMRILQRVPGSVLWLLADNAAAGLNLRKEAAARGVDPARLIFAPRMPRPEHLSRQRAADLFLDTLPCGAHTTASDALWVGLPVLTQAGGTFAGRVAASLLNAIEMPELIAESAEDYEALAVDLATHPEKLTQLKAKLERNRLTTPLFDTALFTGHLETAFEKMIGRYWAGQSPDHIVIAP
jgi:predicted O-linked N-acetylglucosamine transferase (SPINDLY family)